MFISRANREVGEKILLGCINSQSNLIRPYYKVNGIYSIIAQKV